MKTEKVRKRKRNFRPAPRAVFASLPPPSEAERVAESLRVLADLIEKMRSAVGKAGRPPNTVCMAFSKEHDALLTAFIIAVGPYVGPLQLDIPANSYFRGNATLECFWRERRTRNIADTAVAHP